MRIETMLKTSVASLNITEYVRIELRRLRKYNFSGKFNQTIDWTTMTEVVTRNNNE